MNVLYIAGKETEGGAVRSLVEMVTEATRQGVTVEVCTSLNDKLNINLDQRGIQNFSAGFDSPMNPISPYKWKRPLKIPYEFLRYYSSIPRAMKKIEDNVDFNNINIIHTNSARTDIGCYLNKKYGVPHVMHIREFGQEDFNCVISHPKYYDFINKYTTKFVAISEAVKKSWVKKGLQADRIAVVHNGVDNSRILQSVHNNEYSKAVIVGGICDAKGQKEAVEAVCKLIDEGIEISLDIIGWSDPSYEDNLKYFIKNHQHEDRIRFLGSRPTVYSDLQNYDIGLMCSKSEGFGRVTAEYMFAGLGVVASDTGANPELISNMSNGLLYRKGDVEDLANKIKLLIEDKKLLDTISCYAREWANERYTIKRNVEQIVAIYNDIGAR